MSKVREVSLTLIGDDDELDFFLGFLRGHRLVTRALESRENYEVVSNKSFQREYPIAAHFQGLGEVPLDGAGLKADE